MRRGPGTPSGYGGATGRRAARPFVRCRRRRTGFRRHRDRAAGSRSALEWTSQNRIHPRSPVSRRASASEKPDPRLSPPDFCPGTRPAERLSSLDTVSSGAASAGGGNCSFRRWAPPRSARGYRNVWDFPTRLRRNRSPPPDHAASPPPGRPCRPPRRNRG